MDNKAVVLNFLSAADRNDFATVEKLFGPRHNFYSSMSPEPMNTEQHMGMLQGFRSGFTDTKHEILDAFETGSKVAVRGVWHGMHTGTFNGIPASGNAVRLPFIMIVDIEDGEMVNQWLELDAMTMLTQMGVISVHEEAV